MEAKLQDCYICVEGLCPFYACSLIGGSVSVSAQGPRFVDCIGFLVE
jgi:Zn-finger protein